MAIEIKRAARIARTDARNLSGLAEILDKPLLAGLLLSEDREAVRFDRSVIALPSAWVLGPASGLAAREDRRLSSE